MDIAIPDAFKDSGRARLAKEIVDEAMRGSVLVQHLSTLTPCDKAPAEQAAVE